MDPYIAATLAMCGIGLASLIGTAYLAVHFNRRAKGDLQAALAPLAALIDGEVLLDEATVRGRYRQQLAEARMANASEGPGRVFQTEIIDAAGGLPWDYTSTPARDPAEAPTAAFTTDAVDLDAQLGFDWAARLTGIVDPTRERFRLDYDPDAGIVRLTRPMRTRRDIPDAPAFQRQLDLLVAVGDQNRRVQGAELPAGVAAAEVAQ